MNCENLKVTVSSYGTPLSPREKEEKHKIVTGISDKIQTEYLSNTISGLDKLERLRSSS